MPRAIASVPTEDIIAKRCAAAELLMIVFDTAIDDINGHALSRIVSMIEPIEWQPSLIDTVLPPPNRIGGYDSVWLNTHNTTVSEQPGMDSVRHRPGKAVNRMGVHMLGCNAMLARYLSGIDII